MKMPAARNYIVGITMTKYSITSAEREKREADAPEISKSEREAMEEAFFNWWAENDHALSLCGCGDVVGLWAALNAARSL